MDGESIGLGIDLLNVKTKIDVENIEGRLDRVTELSETDHPRDGKTGQLPVYHVLSKLR